MKFATLTKIASASLAAIFAVALVGCGSDSNLTLTQGNWSVAALSNGDFAKQKPLKQNGKLKNQNNQSDVSFYVGGNLTQTGGTISGTMHFIDFCVDPSAAVNFTGTVHGTNVVLTSDTIEEGVITITAAGTSTAATSQITGTYSVSGGCDDGDTGTLTATLVTPITGTWSGTLPCGFASGGCLTPTISVDMTQATTASSDGSFALTGNVTYTSSGCSSTGTITGGNVIGSFVLLDASTADNDDGNGQFTYGEALLDSPSSPANMSGTYTVTFGLCSDNDPTTLTLSLQ